MSGDCLFSHSPGRRNPCLQTMHTVPNNCFRQRWRRKILCDRQIGAAMSPWRTEEVQPLRHPFIDRSLVKSKLEWRSPNSIEVI